MTLSECRRMQLEAGELARAGWTELRAVCLRESSVEERALALAALEGAERERQILAKMEVEIVGAGRVSLEISSDGLEDDSAVMTPEELQEARKRPAKGREAAWSWDREALEKRLSAGEHETPLIG